MDISQMKILHLLTEYAQQNITFNCKNSLLKDDILRFKFFNEQTLSYGKKTSAVLIKTVENACKVILFSIGKFFKKNRILM